MLPQWYFYLVRLYVNAETKGLGEKEAVSSAQFENYEQNTEKLTFNDKNWNYDETNDVYWQIQVGYCSNPETEEYETMGIYVPGAYMNSKKNSDGTYACTINKEKTVGGYTAESAPIVMPVNTAGYSAQKAPTSYSYSGLSSYLDAGYIYVYAGMRGRSNGYDSDGNLSYSGGAPWGVTDLKAAVRYYRLNKDVLPGNTERIFTFGHSGGGAQSSLMGATGDSSLYYDYLMSIGAAMYDADGNYISDAICGAMCWCPITSLDYADEAYEWNMGQYASTGTRADGTWTSALSDDLAEAYAAYINALGLKDETGSELNLEAAENGIYTSGSYYDYLLSVIEGSLNNFLNDTEFPYTESSGMTMGDGGFAGEGNGSNGEKPDGEGPNGDAPNGDAPNGTPPDGNVPSNENSGNTAGAGTTYATAQDYINALNSDEEWISYDAATNTVSISSVGAFVTHCKNAGKDVGAFDDLKRGQAENILFGNDENDALHFDFVLADLLKENTDKYSVYSDWNASVPVEYANDLTAEDKFGNDSKYRQNMYNPMYYLSSYYEGCGTSNVAKYWRIHTGIEQSDTASTVEVNLALALKQCDDVENVEFETVWGQGHTTAERTGSSTDNFIKWINTCLGVVSDTTPNTEPTTSPSAEPDSSPSAAPSENSENKDVQNEVLTKGTVFTAGKLTYKVTNATDGKLAAAVQGPKNKTAKSLTIPVAVKTNGKTYKVTSIAAGAFKNCRKLKKITIGKNITAIGKNAFRNDKLLKQIIVKSAKLKSVGKNALKGIHGKAVIKVPKKKLKSYKKRFKNKGQKKTVKITK